MDPRTQPSATYQDLRAAFDLWTGLVLTFGHHKCRDLELVFSFRAGEEHKLHVHGLEPDPSPAEEQFFAARQHTPHQVHHCGYIADGDFTVRSRHNETPSHSGLRIIADMIESTLPWADNILADIATGQSEWDDEQEAFAKNAFVAWGRIKELRKLR